MAVLWRLSGGACAHPRGSPACQTFVLDWDRHLTTVTLLGQLAADGYVLVGNQLETLGLPLTFINAEVNRSDRDRKRGCPATGCYEHARDGGRIHEKSEMERVTVS